MDTKKKILLVPYCFLTKGFDSSYRKDMDELLKVLLDSGTGIMQMPCPHLFFLTNEDIKGETVSHCSEFIERITHNPEIMFEKILNPLLIKIKKYKQLDVEITGIIGIKNSPVCKIKSNNKISGEDGLFMKMLKQKLCEQSLQIPMANINTPSNFT